FHIRVNDAGARGKGAISVEWRTSYADSRVADERGPLIILLEQSHLPGVFLSAALMLVTDDSDAEQHHMSGMPKDHPDPLVRADAGMRKPGQANFRIRRASMFGSTD